MPRQPQFGVLSSGPKPPAPAPKVEEPEVEAAGDEPEPRKPTPKELARPSADPKAPAVTELTATPAAGGVVLAWAGTQDVQWTVGQVKGGVLGYNVYRAQGTSWVLVAVDAYPPHAVEDAVPGDVFGVAPIYGMADGSVIGGGIVSVTVGR